MMMLPDKKKIASVIISKMKPESDEPKMEEYSSEDVSKDYKMAMEDSAKKMMDAVEKKDAPMFLMHLMDILDMKENSEDD